MSNANSSPRQSEFTSPFAVELDLARLSLAGSRFEEAAVQFTEIIRANPKCPEAWFGLGLARLLGTVNLTAAFSEAMMAFSKARGLSVADIASVDISICRAAVEYYGRLGDVILLLNQSISNAQTNLLCGIGLAALSVVVGSGSHANYFQQTMGVIGTVSGARISVNAFQGHGDSAQTKAFVRSHMDEVRKQLLAVYQVDSVRLEELNDAFQRIDRLVSPERFPSPPIAPRPVPAPIVYDPRRTYRLTDRAILLGLCAGISFRKGVPTVLIRVAPFLLLVICWIIGGALLWFAHKDAPDSANGAVASIMVGGLCFAFPLACLFGGIYLIIGLSVSKLDSRTILKSRTISRKQTERMVQNAALNALMAAPTPTDVNDKRS